MPTPAYAKLLVSVNGGAPTSGRVDVALNDVVQFSIEDSNGAASYRWELYDYPAGFTEPSGWSTASDGTLYSLDAVPDPVTIDVWGKYLPRLRINGDDSDPTLKDESTGISCVSPNGLLDIAEFETTQFSSEGWVGDQQTNLRTIDAAIGGGGGGGLTAPANPADNGKLALASSGNLSYLGGSTAGRPLIWNGTTWAVGGNVDLGTQNFTTTGLTTSGGFMAIHSSANLFSSSLNYRKSHGATSGGAAAIVQVDSQLGNLLWEAWDGAAFQQVARIQATVVDTPAAGNVPTAIDFYTGNNTGALALRVRIDAEGLTAPNFQYGTNATIRHRDATTSTTDASPTVIYTVPELPSDGTIEISVTIDAVEAATGDACTLTKRAFFKVASGTVTQVGSTLDVCSFADAGAATWTCAIATNSTDILVTVTGEASHDIDWTATVIWRERS